MGSSVDDVRPRVEVLRETLGRVVLVAISGIDCAGKSTFAESLATSLRRDRLVATVIHGDELTKPSWDRPGSLDEATDYYDSVDYSQLCSEVIPAAITGQSLSIQLKVTDWERDAWRREPLSLTGVDVLLVEGPFLFRDARESLFDLSIWLEVGWETALARAQARPRDRARFGGPNAVRERYESRYFPAQRMHLDRDNPAAAAALSLPG